MFAWLPMGALSGQLDALASGVAQSDPQAQSAAQAWMQLVRGHALDFHADAGEGGVQWQQACIDALEVWLLLRRQAHPEGRQDWRWNTQYFSAQARPEAPPEYSDPQRWQWGGQPIRALSGLQPWAMAIDNKNLQDAVIQAAQVAQAWPRLDWPSLALALGAQWAVDVVGNVAECDSLLIGGAGGRGNTVLIQWTAAH